MSQSRSSCNRQMEVVASADGRNGRGEPGKKRMGMLINQEEGDKRKVGGENLR